MMLRCTSEVPAYTVPERAVSRNTSIHEMGEV
jgi:hypothetical protein